MYLSNNGTKTFTNKYQRSDVTLRLEDALREGLRLSGAMFKVYCGDTDAHVAYLVEDSNGVYRLSNVDANGNNPCNAVCPVRERAFLLNDMLMYGNYYFMLDVLPDEYHPDVDKATASARKHQFSVLSEGLMYLTNGGGTYDQAVFLIDPMQYTISGYVRNSEGERLPNALVGVFPAGTTDFTEDNVLDGLMMYTGPNGEFMFEGLFAGEYIVAQITPPGGYIPVEERALPVAVALNSKADPATYTGIVFVDETPEKIAADSPGAVSQETTGGGTAVAVQGEQAKGTNSKTGDETPIWPYVLALIAGAAAIAVVWMLRKHRRASR